MFERLKEYLGRPPLLVSPRLGEILFVYVRVTDLGVVTVLLKQESNVQKPVYYVSKALPDVEIRFFHAKKVSLLYCYCCPQT